MVYLQRLYAVLKTFWADLLESMNEDDPDYLPSTSNATTSRETVVKPHMDTVPTTVPESKPDMLTTFCTAIMNFEGGPGDLNHLNNNPGDFRCSPVGYLPKYGNVKCVHNFAVFPTFELGWEYLVASVHYRAAAHPNWTILDFFENYAPPSDNNPTEKYAQTVAAACGVPVDTTMRALFG
jgi:hypothetical protein